jgi:hypothetical protein
LCAPHKIVESIQGTLQLSILKHAGQARYCQPKQQHQYEHSENNLDQRKAPQPLHRRTYSTEAKSQQGSGRRGDLVSAPALKPTWILSSVLTRRFQQKATKPSPRQIHYRSGMKTKAVLRRSATAVFAAFVSFDSQPTHSCDIC